MSSDWIHMDIFILFFHKEIKKDNSNGVKSWQTESYEWKKVPLEKYLYLCLP